MPSRGDFSLINSRWADFPFCPARGFSVEPRLRPTARNVFRGRVTEKGNMIHFVPVTFRFLPPTDVKKLRVFCSYGMQPLSPL